MTTAPIYTRKQFILIFSLTMILGFAALYAAPFVGKYIDGTTLRLAAMILASIGLIVIASSKPLRNPNVFLGSEGTLDRIGSVVETCNPNGTVRLGTELWNATSLNGELIPAGEAVIVRKIDGLCLFVERSSPA
jgi:membrane protein implicated in regulation of membrane protease activity